MRVAINGWFGDQLGTGSGQYLAALRAWLPEAGEQHEYVLVEPRRKAASAREDRTGSGSGTETGQEPWRVLAVGTPFDSRSANLAKVWFEQVSFPQACRKVRADVALTPYWGSPWWRPCPLVVTVHDIIPLLLPLYRGGPAQRAYTWLVSRTARRAAAVITDSAASRRDIIAHLGIAAARVHAVHLAVDPRFRPVSDSHALARARERYHLPDRPFLLYLGGFDARKNVPRLLEAYARLAEGAGAPPPPLVIAGRLPAGDTLFAPHPGRVAERLGLSGVHFTGWVDEADKPALYSLALAAVFVSEYEGFGLPVLEAQACGCPVVTSL